MAIGLVEEARKLPAFFRRDFLVMWSYRVAFVADWINMLAQVLIFSLVGRLVDPSVLPAIGGRPTTYIEFVATGIALTSFLQIALGRVVSTLRDEQMMGTLESLLVTPTAPMTIQLGSVMYDLAYVPVRTLLFVGMASLAFGVRIAPSGVGPMIVILLVFLPLVWGLGLIAAAAVLTLRRGAGLLGVAVTALMIGSNTYFPIDVLPSWARAVAHANPLTVALDGVRGALLGGQGWSSLWPTLAILLPMAAASMVAGLAAFRFALHRERRRGSMGLY